MTAVEKAIERLTNLHLVIPTNTKENRNIKGVYVHCIMILKEHLELEKQQIIEAYNDGQAIPPFDYAETYYNKFYKKE